jgi:hypothetical protein
MNYHWALLLVLYQGSSLFLRIVRLVTNRCAEREMFMIRTFVDCTAVGRYSHSWKMLPNHNCPIKPESGKLKDFVHVRSKSIEQIYRHIKQWIQCTDNMY